MPGLSTAWRAGALLYRGRGAVDASFGATSWDDAARFVETHAPAEPLEELQYWGHGRFGRIFVDRDVLDASALDAQRPHRFFAVLRERLSSRRARSLFWMRTCEAFGGHVGHDFAQRLADFLGVPVAGHTHVIGFWQSGLHGLAPGARPDWSPSEGVARGNADAPELGVWSTPDAPHTISCLEGSVPPTWFARQGSHASSASTNAVG